MLRQQRQVVGFEAGAYLSRRLWANSTGGARVPVSLAYRGDAVQLDGSDPLLLQAYGAYGAAFDPAFSSEGGRGRGRVWLDWKRAPCLASPAIRCLPTFSSTDAPPAPLAPPLAGELLSLLDRGFVYAIAHVRGGGDMGQYW